MKKELDYQILIADFGIVAASLFQKCSNKKEIENLKRSLIFNLDNIADDKEREL